MFLKKIGLTNFRNYENLELDLSNGINVFFGKNASGKTNILEAVYVCGLTKSYRATKDIELINFDKTFCKVVNTYEGENGQKNSVEVIIQSDSQKQIRENEIKTQKFADHIGKYLITTFSPEKMNIVQGSPKDRRKYLDILISQLSKKYIIILQEYNKLLKIKNNLLRGESKNIDEGYLDILDENLAEKIEYIIAKRIEYVDKVDKEAKRITKAISEEKEKIKVKYLSELQGLNKEELVSIFKSSRNFDIARKSSSKNISRDDLEIFVNEKDVSKFGSQGQNRTATLSMKIAEVEILKKEKGTSPIILLDDVFSELDEKRIKFLLEYVKDYQTIITTTEIENIKKMKNITFFEVKNGRVEKKNN